jgi:hypothetical protein
MAIKTYKARVRIKNASGSSIEQDVTVQADSSSKARFMLEAQYGKGCILSGEPREVR